MTNLNLPQIQKEETEEEINEVEEPQIKPQEVFKTEEKPKQRRKRKPLTEEQKEKLAVARQRSLEVRQEKARRGLK